MKRYTPRIKVEEGKEKVILFNYSGHGLLDLAGYEKFFEGELSDYTPSQEELKVYLDSIQNLPRPSAQRSGRW